MAGLYGDTPELDAAGKAVTDFLGSGVILPYIADRYSKVRNFANEQLLPAIGRQALGPVGMGFGPTSSAPSRLTQGAKSPLSTIAEDYASKVDPKAFVNRMTSRAQGDQQGALNLLLSQMYETSGGPNQAAIRQLEAQRLAAQKNYKTNRADAQNLYGVLSQDIQGMGTDLQTSYGAAIGESQSTASARQAALSAEQARQQANRERAAAELGIAAESALTSYTSDEALNKAMGDVAANATNWENLLRGQQASAQERTNRMVTATGNTKTQTLLGMKAFLDAQQAQINAQIAGERGKTPTQKLTPLGKLLSGAMNDQTLKKAQAQFPDLFGSAGVQLTPGEQAAQNAMTQYGIGPQEYSTLLSSAMLKAREGRQGEMSDMEVFILNSANIPQWMLGG
jgi:hypothetical protein